MAASDRGSTDRHAVLLRARASALGSEAAGPVVETARLEAKVDPAKIARVVVGLSKWGSELPPPLLQQLLELLRWEHAAPYGRRAPRGAPYTTRRAVS
jgi:hypothetical protein